MRQLISIRIPWAATNEGKVYYEFVIEKFYSDLGTCQSIIERAPGSYEVTFEDKFLSYTDGVIATGYINTTGDEDKG